MPHTRTLSQDRSADVRKLAQVTVQYIVESCGYASVDAAVDHLRVKPAALTSIRTALTKLRDTLSPRVCPPRLLLFFSGLRAHDTLCIMFAGGICCSPCARATPGKGMASPAYCVSLRHKLLQRPLLCPRRPL